MESKKIIESKEYTYGLRDVDPQLTSIESTILAMLQTHTHLPDQTIDIPLLQDECLESGLTASEFSHGFVRLLTRRLLEPRGDFTFGLSDEGHRLKDVVCRLKDGLSGKPSTSAELREKNAN